MIAYKTGDGPDVVTVDAVAMQDLTEKYTQYRDALYGGQAFDPVRALHLTGEVLASVREIVVNGHKTKEPAAEEEPPR
ncbi:hypothetical protein [Arthrobacter bambusae]|uniref:Uncharacterized protein n=1 Tax=Arthrobacter bambusae TaxID=1338426 RepID=A0AAP4ZSN8_9MICC|nr:hypothetical protein [Arthrobacter bambusae]MDP9903241.1 hypothetical protein [Arthrobacter bambusae]MDP9904691.1 hypothetical protein [Arthrobacter bambusae]MDQ0128765.1 hypothetical protein [Arthrobacter bambusae]MDQ0129507.1 hypothetical protein [Arthrobacter bambusae]MDQ0180106.1 hypothetical protein [Arthrobacter bambusae]